MTARSLLLHLSPPVICNLGVGREKWWILAKLEQSNLSQSLQGPLSSINLEYSIFQFEGKLFYVEKMLKGSLTSSSCIVPNKCYAKVTKLSSLESLLHHSMKYAFPLLHHHTSRFFSHWSSINWRKEKVIHFANISHPHKTWVASRMRITHF